MIEEVATQRRMGYQPHAYRMMLPHDNRMNTIGQNLHELGLLVDARKGAHVNLWGLCNPIPLTGRDAHPAGTKPYRAVYVAEALSA
jgi:hypothetical protein